MTMQHSIPRAARRSAGVRQRGVGGSLAAQGSDAQIDGPFSGRKMRPAPRRLAHIRYQPWRTPPEGGPTALALLPQPRDSQWPAEFQQATLAYLQRELGMDIEV
jgi:hypothetical protein